MEKEVNGKSKKVKSSVDKENNKVGKNKENNSNSKTKVKKISEKENKKRETEEKSSNINKEEIAKIKSIDKEAEKIEKRENVNKKYLVWGIIFLIITLILSLIMFNTKKANPDEAVAFINVRDEGVYSNIDVDLMSYSIDDDYSKDTIHIVVEDNNFYLVKLKFEDWDKTSEIRDYTYSSSISSKPESIMLYGKSVKIDEETKELAIKAYNKFGTSTNITEDNFDTYFGSYYLDTSLEPNGDTRAFLGIAIMISLTLSTIFLVKYFKTKEKFILYTTIFLALSWVMFFVINSTDDFEDTLMVMVGFYLIIVATIVFIYSLITGKNANKPTAISKNNQSTTTLNAPLATNVLKTKLKENEYTDKSKEKILQMIYEKFEQFLKDYRIFLLFFSGWESSYTNADEDADKMRFVDYSEQEFKGSLFARMIINSTDEEKEKTIEFIRNIDSDIVDDLETEFNLDKEKLKNKMEADKTDYINKNYSGFDFDKWQKQAFHELLRMKDSGWELTEEIWREFIINIENAFNAYVEPVTPLNLLGEYKKTVSENASSSNLKAFYMFYLPIGIIIVMVIDFLKAIFSPQEESIVMSCGWWSLAIFIVLIIWACVGNEGRNTTCSKCKKWGSLTLVKDTIIASENAIRNRTETDRNGRQYTRQVMVRVDKHKLEYVCNHCGSEETRYSTTEREL